MKIRTKISILLALLTAISAWLQKSIIGFGFSGGEGTP